MADEQAVAPAPAITALYTVHNPHVSPTATRATVNGREMLATVDMLEVELVADNLSNGGIKLRFMGDDVEAARALFVTDAKIVASFAAEG
jgi:hypothetical protein